MVGWIKPVDWNIGDMDWFPRRKEDRIEEKLDKIIKLLEDGMDKE